MTNKEITVLCHESYKRGAKDIQKLMNALFTEFFDQCDKQLFTLKQEGNNGLN